MAEIAGAAAGIANTVIKLSEVLYFKFKFLHDVKDEVERLKSELIWMQTFLKDAKTKLDNNDNLIRQWVSDVRDLSFEAEDVIDTFHIKLGRESHSCSCIFFGKNVLATHKLGCNLDKLMKKAREISSRRERYGLTNDVSNPSRSEIKLKELRETTSYAKKEHIFGLHNTVTILKDRLLNGNPKRCMLSILGMGGLGKTTLARKLYDEVRSEYPCSAWVCVSQDYRTQDLLLGLIASMLGSPSNTLTTINSMQAYLQEGLSGKKFLIVLDDMWETEAWESIHNAFPDETTSSRVIITTRIEDVAKLNNAFVHHLQKLDKNDSWDLFCQKVSINDTDIESQELGKIMVEKCDGLPLAIVTLGGILSKAKGISEWEVVKDNLWKEIEKGTIHIDAVLTLSFNFLPDYLKLCYLYVGMFPEDYEIPTSKLMLLWEAEGLIEEEEEDVSSESKAKLYLNELVRRSLLQDTGEDLINSTCRVHDLLRDLIIKKAKDIRFSEFYGENQKLNSLKILPPRRLTMCDINWQAIQYSNSSLRTLHLVQQLKGYSVPLSDYLTNHLPIRFDLLRVLDIQVFEMPHCSIKVGKLISLRYLGLVARFPFNVSKCVGDLKELQTLFVKANVAGEMPGTVVKLQKLRNLLGNFDSGHLRIGELAGLTTLEINGCKDWCNLDTTNLVNLRHLTLGMEDFGDETCTSERFLPNFHNLSGLRTLKFYREYPFDILEIFKRCTRITHLRCNGLYSLPTSSYLPGPSENRFLFDVATHLEVVNWVFVDAENSQTSISSLEKLPRLRALQLSPRNKLHLDLNISEEAFIQLRTLCIKLSRKISYSKHPAHMTLKLKVPDSSMPKLTDLSVDVPANLTVSDRLKRMIYAHC